MTLNFIVRTASFCFLLLLLSFTTQAQNLISARILSFEGSIEIKRKQSGNELKKISFKLNQEIEPGDVIQTGWNGRLVLGLSDGSMAVLGADTKVEVADFRNSPKTLFNVLKGKTRIKIEKMGGKPNPYRVNTPTAVIAVRGTVFDVFVKKNQTDVYLIEGEVLVSNFLHPDKQVVLTSGQKTKVVGEDAPTNPEKFKTERNDYYFQPRRRVISETTDGADTTIVDRPITTRPTTRTQTTTPTTTRQPTTRP
jgi:hypothetical protein